MSNNPEKTISDMLYERIGRALEEAVRNGLFYGPRRLGYEEKAHLGIISEDELKRFRDEKREILRQAKLDFERGVITEAELKRTKRDIESRIKLIQDNAVIDELLEEAVIESKKLVAAFLKRGKYSITDAEYHAIRRLGMARLVPEGSWPSYKSRNIENVKEIKNFDIMEAYEKIRNQLEVFALVEYYDVGSKALKINKFLQEEVMKRYDSLTNEAGTSTSGESATADYSGLEPDVHAYHKTIDYLGHRVDLVFLSLLKESNERAFQYALIKYNRFKADATIGKEKETPIGTDISDLKGASQPREAAPDPAESASNISRENLAKLITEDQSEILIAKIVYGKTTRQIVIALNDERKALGEPKIDGAWVEAQYRKALDELSKVTEIDETW